MKFLKVLLIVILVLAGLFLVVPVFLPSSVTVSSEIEIALTPMQVFKNASVFTDREKWDPWLQMEPEAEVTINPAKSIVGSTYEWEGEEIGSGRMQVDSIVPGKYIASSIWFGKNPDASLVEWILEDAGGRTKVTWQFTSKGSYPVGRLFNLFMKGGLKSSFDSGLADFKKYIEANPPAMYKLSEIKIDEFAATDAMVVAANCTMEELGAKMGEIFPKIFQAIGEQGLEVKGAAFTYYLDFDEETGKSNVLVGMPVIKAGKASGDVMPKHIPAMKAVVAMHFGPYEFFSKSYDTMGKYIEENGLEVTGEAFEIYMKTMMEAQDPNKWETLIGFPLK